MWGYAEEHALHDLHTRTDRCTIKTHEKKNKIKKVFIKISEVTRYKNSRVHFRQDDIHLCTTNNKKCSQKKPIIKKNTPTHCNDHWWDSCMLVEEWSICLTKGNDVLAWEIMGLCRFSRSLQGVRALPWKCTSFFLGIGSLVEEREISTEPKRAVVFFVSTKFLSDHLHKLFHPFPY